MKKDYRFACALTLLVFAQVCYASQQQGGEGSEKARPKAEKRQGGPPYNHLFAEMTESYYGFNDHYPFIQFELSRDDPNLCDLLAEIWGGKAK